MTVTASRAITGVPLEPQRRNRSAAPRTNRNGDSSSSSAVRRSKKARPAAGEQMRKQQRSRTYTASSARVPAEARRKAVSKTQSSVAIRYWVILSLVIGVVIYTSFSLLLRYTDLQKTNQENRALSAAIDSLTAEHDTLSMNLTPYLDPTRIETLARQRLHMDHPSSAQVILAEEAQSPEKTAEGSDPQLAALASAASQR